MAGPKDDDELDLNDIDDIDDLDDIDTDEFNTEFDPVSEERPYEEDPDDNVADYTGGVSVDASDLMEEDDEPEISEDDHDIVSMSGDFVVQKDINSDTAFELRVIDIDSIAITQRVRQNINAEDITRSIKSTGLLMPIVVAPTKTTGIYVLIDGWRRLMGCARAGKRMIPVVINNNVSTQDIPILESMYNHSRKYSVQEMVSHINYLEVEKGIMNPSMIEYLLQMNSGDYTKLKDILNDNDEDITDKLYSGVWDIETAFRKLEQRRKKESADEKENKKAEAVYGDEEKSGMDQIEGSGEEAEGESLSDEQINDIMINVENLDEDVKESDLGEMIETDKNIKGFEPHKQKVGEREYIDPAIRKAVMARDNSTCQCCKRGGPQYSDVLDLHHVLPVFLGGVDDTKNSIMLCVTCHRLVHLYSTGDLTVDSALLESSYDELDEETKLRYPNEQIFEDEKMRFKRIIKLGSVIRKGIAQKGLNREKFKEEHSNAGIGRRKPGVNAQQDRS